MAKKKPNQEGDAAPVPPSKLATAKVDREVLRRARIVAGARGINLYEYLDAIFRSAVNDDYRRFIREEASHPPTD